MSDPSEACLGHRRGVAPALESCQIRVPRAIPRRKDAALETVAYQFDRCKLLPTERQLLVDGKPVREAVALRSVQGGAPASG